jgi:RNA polymerase sigma-70 factor (ECF subfamily)
VSAAKDTVSGMMNPSTNEMELFERAVGGDSDAFGAMVQPHLALFYNGINRILGNEADSQDALQDALMSIHRDLSRFEGRSRFSSWGYRI